MGSNRRSIPGNLCTVYTTKYRSPVHKARISIFRENLPDKGHHGTFPRKKRENPSGNHHIPLPIAAKTLVRRRVAGAERLFKKMKLFRRKHLFGSTIF